VTLEPKKYEEEAAPRKLLITEREKDYRTERGYPLNTHTHTHTLCSHERTLARLIVKVIDLSEDRVGSLFQKQRIVGC